MQLHQVGVVPAHAVGQAAEVDQAVEEEGVAGVVVVWFQGGMGGRVGERRLFDKGRDSHRRDSESDHPPQQQKICGEIDMLHYLHR